ncbi:hypothetical protein [Listeria booriae]|uniref:Uncharacterized protein n=1 Tax=Listeria booriae TaxID=1552123 RepID=A0A7X1CI55_9LIST|nr:hypothetical protein [Listeria booriae]MBC1778661.1 hypothetical protein [Listeria booriae]
MIKNGIEDKLVEVMKMVEIRAYLQQISELVETLDYLLGSYADKQTSDLCDVLNKRGTVDDSATVGLDSVIMVDPIGQARIVSSNMSELEETEDCSSGAMHHFLAALLGIQ